MPLLTRRDALSAASTALLLSARSAIAAPDAATPRRGGTLTALITPEPVTLNRGINSAMPTSVIAASIFDGLVRYDFDLKAKPQLAERWEIAPDRRTITFHLRRGVRWHDGTPFTAADVKWTAENVWKTLLPNRSLFDTLDGADAPDDSTVILRFSAPSLAVLASINAIGAPILPQHLLDGTDILSSPFGSFPVGTGPFLFKEWDRGSHIVLERNPTYWDAPKPYLDRVVYRFIADASARSIAFETGEVQFAPFSPVALQDVERLSGSPGLRLEQRGYEWVGAWLYLEFNLDNPYLRDPRVRRAIAHAIHRDSIAEVVWYGYGRPAISPVPSSGGAFFDPTVPQYPYDPKRAEALLDAAGFPRDQDGIRFSLRHDPLPYGDDFHRTGEFVRQSLKRVGIDVTLRAADTAVFLKRVYKDRDFDISSSWTGFYSDPQVGYGKLYTSAIIGKGVPWTNGSGYRNAEVDAIFAEAGREPDQERRIALFKRFQHIVQTDLPVLPLIELRFFTLLAANLRDAVTACDQSLRDAWLTSPTG